MVGEVQGEIDVLVHLVLLITAGFVPDGLPGGGRSAMLEPNRKWYWCLASFSISWRILSSALRPKRRMGMS